MPAEAPCQTDYDFIFPHTKERRARKLMLKEKSSLTRETDAVKEM
ncbi:hypothetical protein B4064_1030 [Caldibacillus thermoamylovorans]|nr:hypothetical protein B4064_1030 [Caldibacillus thermoamylovorans]KIO69495.1 hypothetical protein B4065_1428 [Caldibacillus thermoamylovorans]